MYNTGKLIFDLLAFIVNAGKSEYDKLHKKYSYYMRRKHIMVVNEQYRSCRKHSLWEKEHGF